jgi:hypothetical protein
MFLSEDAFDLDGDDAGCVFSFSFPLSRATASNDRGRRFTVNAAPSDEAGSTSSP